MEDDNKLNKRIAEIWAVLSEVATSQAKTDAQMAKTDAQMAETDKRLKELSLQTAETDKQLKELSLQTAETDQRLKELSSQTAKTDKRLNKLILGNESIQGFIKNESSACEQRFVDSLEMHGLRVAGVTFDEIFSNVSKTRGGKNIELDALLVNGDSVALVEVKKKLHLGDVVKVRNNLIGRFRDLFPEHRDRRLLVLVAGESVNGDAESEALEAGFVVLSFKARKLQMQIQQARYY